MRKSQNTLCLIFSIIDNFCKHLKRNRHKIGPKYQYSRNQIIKMMVLKYLLGISSDHSFIRFLSNFGGGLFKNIPHHSLFGRRSKKTSSSFETYLLKKLKVEDGNIRIIDSTSVPYWLLSKSLRKTGLLI